MCLRIGVVGNTLLHRRRHIFVSTVFLGLDHGWRERQWFETMIFGTSIDGYQRRYGTWDEAVRGHAIAVGRARQARWVRNPHTQRAWKKSMKEIRRFNRESRRFQSSPRLG